ncbi:hypothetical protein [Pseudoalteromonas xiamenensis]|uniref:Uncharacterized protein n=1 Tax=Pseudoalteromonas xiamenensis TaxID=882626 RepID=A0A975DN65_9GAMM|nr:hypothetical protein [Pseudoalteromonas xiamenensis]QTH73476.1 hypothetical protein J5O05_18455 [Pseudoalteromonas xiamenensis]
MSWQLVLLLIFPIQFKIYGYITRKDKSPLWVKIEAMSNAFFLAMGLIVFYGLINDVIYFTPIFWNFWLIIAVIWLMVCLYGHQKSNTLFKF